MSMVSGTGVAVPQASRLRRSVRLIHLYAGGVVSPLLLLIGISAILLNHGWKPLAVPAQTGSAAVTLPPAPASMAGARMILDSIGVIGEIEWIDHAPQAQRLRIPVMKPGVRTEVIVDLARSQASWTTRRTGMADAMMYLHKSPGPHHASIRGNWLPTKLWAITSDALVYLTLLLTLSGLYLWVALRSQRRVGLVCLGMGLATFTVLVLALAW